MFRLSDYSHFLGFGAVSVAILLAGCGGSSSGGPKLTTIDQEWAEGALTWVEEVAPGCESQDAAPSVATVLTSINQVEELASLASTRAISANSPASRSDSAPRSISIPGICGGLVNIVSDHASGSTAFTMAFEQYCMAVPAEVATLSADKSVNGADGKATADELRIDGVVDALQVGKPTDFGPLVSEFNSSFKDLALTRGAERTVVSVDAARTVYGRPSTWSPFYPTETDPDKFSVKKVSMDFETRGTVDELRNLSGTRWGPTDMAVVDINTGSYVRGETGEAFNVATPAGQSIVVNIEQANWVSGEVDLVGASGTSMTVEPTTTGSFSVVLNGESAGSADCAAGQEPLEHIVDLIVEELPIY